MTEISYAGHELHPAASLFPAMSESEINALADDIERNGLIEPIVLHEGKILDGRNRLIACGIADVAPRYTEWDGTGGSPTLYAVSRNKLRRHLTPGQLAMLADDMRPLLESEAAERQKTSQFGSRQDGHEKPNSSTTSGVRTRADTVPERRGTAAAAARVTGASPRATEQARELKKKAPDVAEDVRAGKKSMRAGLEEANRRMSRAPDLDPKSVKDALGQAVPKELLPGWGATSRAIAAVDAHLKAAQAAWSKVRKEELDLVAKSSRAAARLAVEGEQLLRGAAGETLRLFSERFRELAPFAVCLNCDGNGGCPGKKCQRVRLAGEGKGTCNCKNKLCGLCDGTGILTVKEKAATKQQIGARR